MTGSGRDTSLIELADHAHPAWRNFSAVMDRDRGKYDARELAEAWRWFRIGWDSKVAQLKGEATDWWCNVW